MFLAEQVESISHSSQGPPSLLSQHSEQEELSMAPRSSLLRRTC